MRVSMKNRSLPFYLDGRSDMSQRGTKAEVDVGLVCEQIFDGGDLFEVTKTAASAALADAKYSRVRAKWRAKNAKAQHDMDRAASWTAYHAGRVDEFRHLLEDQVIDALGEEVEAEIVAPTVEDEEDGDDD